jgi:PTH1 family peptidyl-tRNA hydrolase
VKLIVGLGNPGGRYRGTYHNIGFEVVDRVAARQGVAFAAAPVEAVMARVRGWGDGVLLAKPLTFMNLSGGPVGALARYFRVETPDLLVVLDDVALPLGRLRARPSGSAGGHNGLRSVIDAMGTEEVPRLRVGVGRGHPERDLADHVLARIPEGEREALGEAVERAAEACELFVTHGIDEVMNLYNREI